MQRIELSHINKQTCWIWSCPGFNKNIITSSTIQQRTLENNRSSQKIPAGKTNLFTKNPVGKANLFTKILWERKDDLFTKNPTGKAYILQQIPREILTWKEDKSDHKIHNSKVKKFDRKQSKLKKMLATFLFI